MSGWMCDAFWSEDPLPTSPDSPTMRVPSMKKLPPKDVSFATGEPTVSMRMLGYDASPMKRQGKVRTIR
jgi:hypothetical protein